MAQGQSFEGVGKDSRISDSAITYFVDPVGGNDSNNGLSWGTAFKTIGRIQQVAPYFVKGAYVGIVGYLAAGTYKETESLIAYPLSRTTRFSLIGQTDVYGVPTSIIDCENTRNGIVTSVDIQNYINNVRIINIPSNHYGILGSENPYLYVDNIDIVPYTGATGVTGVKASQGILLAKRVFVDSCNIGIEAIAGCLAEIGYGTLYTGTHTGANGASVLADNTKAFTVGVLRGKVWNKTTGAMGTPITAQTATTVTVSMSGGIRQLWNTGDSYWVFDGSNTITNCTTSGAYIADVSGGHCDYNTFTGNNAGLQIGRNCTINYGDNEFVSNTNAVYAPHGGVIYDDGGNVFTSNTHDRSLLSGNTTYIDVSGNISTPWDAYSALPTAALFYRYSPAVDYGGAGVTDAPYICLKNASDTYEWRNIVALSPNSYYNPTTDCLGLGQSNPIYPIDIYRAGTGTVATRMRWSTHHNTTGEDHSSSMYSGDDGVGTIRLLQLCAGPLNAGTANQGRTDWLTEDGTKYMAILRSLNSENGARLDLYNRDSGSGTVTTRLHTAGTSYFNGGAVAIGATSANASALLDLTSTTQGFLPPRGTTTQKNAISNPAKGLMFYDTTLDAFYGYNGAWISLAADLSTYAPLASPTLSGTVTIPTPFTIGAVSMTATGTELNYVAGVTSSIQTQFGLKAPLASPQLTGLPVITNNYADSSTYNLFTFRNQGSGYGTWGFAKVGSNDFALMQGVNTDSPATVAMRVNYNSANALFGFGGTTPTSSVHTKSFARAAIAKSTTYTATVSDSHFNLTAASGWTLTLPAASGCIGREYSFKKTDNNINVITIQGNASENIDGANTYIGLLAQYKYLKIICNAGGTGWDIIDSN